MSSELVIYNSVEFIRLRPMDIVYVESDGNYSDFHLLGDEKRTAGVQLGQVEGLIEQQLTDAIFIRVGKRVIVNKDYIYYIQPTKQKLILRDNLGHSYNVQHVSVDSLHKLQNTLIELLKKDEK